MKSLFFALLLTLSLQAATIGGVAATVKGEAITLYELKKEMQLLKLDASKALDSLIRKKLESQEIAERNIDVSSSEVFDDIKKSAERNNMSVSEFYEAVRNANGLSSSELKEKIREKLLSQKLYQAIAYTSLSEPDEGQIKEYFELHKADFAHPKSFLTVLYQAKEAAQLQEKIDNPMFYSPQIASGEQRLEYERLSPELAAMLERTPLNSFTQIVPDGAGNYMTFYLKEIEASTTTDLESNRAQIVNLLMGEKREQVLSDYFARLRHNADIAIIRTGE